MVDDPVYLLDTSTIVALIRGRHDHARGRFRDAEGRLGTSTVTVMELEFGAERARDRRRARGEVDELVSLVDVLPFDELAAMHAGRVRAQLAAAGTPIGPYDTLLAGHARSLGLVMVTHNAKEFERVPGLEVQDWLGSNSTT